jgi:CxxC motif-containing protein (DUF1111 family)
VRKIKTLLILICGGALLVASSALQPASESAIAKNNQGGATEAPTGFDNQTNGFVNQTEFDGARSLFEELETIEDGLGPVYNAQGCVECHQNPVTGGISQIDEHRAGMLDRSKNFVEAPGGSLIHDRAINPAIQERVPLNSTIITARTSLNTLGDGFVEAIADETLVAIAENQKKQSKGKIAGLVIRVPVLEANGALRVGRFGWKNQHASLLSFSADAYLNEMGITSPLQPVENTSLGRSIAAFDKVPDPEDDGIDVEGFAIFMRATKAPPRSDRCEVCPNPDPKIVEGKRIFDRIGCAICHVPTIVTAPVGAKFNGGKLTINEALGNKIIHPYGDFLLHDLGTGDGIVQNGPVTTANKMRTAPLWGVRTRTRLMHDGLSLTFEDAILRHDNEGRESCRKFKGLNRQEKDALFAFLESL